MSSKAHLRQTAPRPERLSAYVTAAVRRYRYLPFFRVDVQIVDVSAEGVKLQFPTDVRARPGSRFWLEVPKTLITPRQSGAFLFQAEVRWYRSGDHMLGATLDASDPEVGGVMPGLMERLKQLGRTAT